MNVPAHLKYTKSHEWVRAEADGTITVGITEHAQDLLGDLVFIDLPDVGKALVADLQAHLKEGRAIQGEKILEEVRRAELPAYLGATREALQCLVWQCRMVESTLLVDT